jgi:hypothetical protein
MEAETVRKLRQSCHFLMQFDKLTDLVNFTEHLVYGRYLNGNSIEENMLFSCQQPPQVLTISISLRKLLFNCDQRSPSPNWMLLPICRLGEKSQKSKFSELFHKKTRPRQQLLGYGNIGGTGRRVVRVRHQYAKFRIILD